MFSFIPQPFSFRGKIPKLHYRAHKKLILLALFQNSNQINKLFPIFVAPILVLSFHLSALILPGNIYCLCASCSSHLNSKFIALKFVLTVAPEVPVYVILSVRLLSHCSVQKPSFLTVRFKSPRQDSDCIQPVVISYETPRFRST